MNDRLVLGTVQFGLEYGVAHQGGRVPSDEVKSILQKAADQGISMLDTAIAYGDSESILGQSGVSDWHVVTKLPGLPEECTDVAGWVEAQIDGSLNHLGVHELHGVLLHRPEQVLGKNGGALVQALCRARMHGKCRKIGVSIYAPEELSKLAGVMPLDLVQAPLSILDRRLVESGWVGKLKDQGTEWHVRSIFLQGLLLMPADQRPLKFSRWNGVWSEWTRWLSETGLSPLQACLAYVLAVQEIDRVVVGVDSVHHLQEILAAAQARLPCLPNWPLTMDADLINPSRWNQI